MTEYSTDHEELGVEVPVELINLETLRSVISEFVTREWEEIGEQSYTLDQKIEQVLVQLQENKAKIVFDTTSNSCNIVVRR